MMKNPVLCESYSAWRSEGMPKVRQILDRHEPRLRVGSIDRGGDLSGQADFALSLGYLHISLTYLAE